METSQKKVLTDKNQLENYPTLIYTKAEKKKGAINILYRNNIIWIFYQLKEYGRSVH